MNFLSHFYFDRDSDNPNKVIGVVLPDLVKNAKKDWTIRPEKKEDAFRADEGLLSLLTGWNRHLEVDKHFHCSDFFINYTREIRTAIAPILVNSPARPSFVGHIALELMLDGLLLTESIIDASDFYNQINKSDRQAINEFLLLNNINETEVFFTFLDEFIQAEYLNSYREANNIMYALNRVCMRVWEEPFNDTQKLQLTAVLLDFQQQLKHNFFDIFVEINGRLT